MNRELSPSESAALTQLLRADFPGAQELRIQAGAVRAVGTCGCGSLDLEVPASAPRPAVPLASPIASELEVVDQAGAPEGGIILFLDEDGALSYLEHYTYDNPGGGFPLPERLVLAARA